MNKQTLTVVKSDYRDNAHEAVLQKIEIIGDYAPLDSDEWGLAVSEYKIERDYFFQVPPDDPSKCSRKIIFSSFLSKCAPVINIELSCGSQRQMKTFSLERHFTGEAKIFSALPDRKVGEAEAASLFHNFTREMWLINDGFLSKALQDVEEEQLKRKFAAHKDKGKEKNAEGIQLLTVEDEFITEEEFWRKKVEETHEKSENSQRGDELQENDYITEDELLESRNML